MKTFAFAGQGFRGKTKKAAMVEAEAYFARIHSLLNQGTYDREFAPGIGPNWTIIVYPTLYGWTYNIFKNGVHEVTGSSAESANRTATYAYAANHAAQMAYAPYQGKELREVARSIAASGGAATLAEFDHWAGWQDRYAGGQERGMTGTEAHAWASHGTIPARMESEPASI